MPYSDSTFRYDITQYPSTRGGFDQNTMSGSDVFVQFFTKYSYKRIASKNKLMDHVLETTKKVFTLQCPSRNFENKILHDTYIEISIGE